jgi:hypothetical protein
METLSSEELEAERLYYALVSWSLCKRAFVILAKDLTARSEVAGAYLCWLILRGQEWPTVGGGGPKLITTQVQATIRA